jgi:hypothetical protein
MPMTKPNDEVAAEAPLEHIPDDPGYHNKNLPESITRVIDGGTWKRQDTVVLLPADTLVPMKCAMSWWGLIFPANNGVVKIGLTGQEVGEAYSNAVQMVLDTPQLHKFKYILTIEHDNVPPQDGVLRLMKRMEEFPEYSAISGLYWTKGEGGAPQIWGDINDPQLNFRPQPPDPNGGVVECCGIGMGFALWRIDMFKDEKLRKPWFKTTSSKEEGMCTQDLYFWTDARKFGYRCAVACDVLVGHFDHKTGINW